MHGFLSAIQEILIATHTPLSSHTHPITLWSSKLLLCLLPQSYTTFLTLLMKSAQNSSLPRTLLPAIEFTQRVC